MFDQLTFMPGWFHALPTWLILVGIGAIGYTIAMLIGKLLAAIFVTPWRQIAEQADKEQEIDDDRQNSNYI